MPKDLTFEIAPDLCGDFPELEVRLLRARIADQSALAPALARLSGPLGAAAEALRDIEPITSLEDIARWRRAYAGIGVKPSKFPSSLEALMRRAKKGQMAEVGIPAVDLYNAISVIRRAPLGAYDMARLGPEPMLLRRANPADDRFEPLGAACSCRTPSFTKLSGRSSARAIASIPPACSAGRQALSWPERKS